MSNFLLLVFKCVSFTIDRGCCFITGPIPVWALWSSQELISLVFSTTTNRSTNATFYIFRWTDVVLPTPHSEYSNSVQLFLWTTCHVMNPSKPLHIMVQLLRSCCFADYFTAILHHFFKLRILIGWRSCQSISPVWCLLYRHLQLSKFT